MKEHVCDGTTSEAVMKLLSPVLASNIKEIKKQSVKSIMEIYNIKSTANLSIKSFSKFTSRNIQVRDKRPSLCSNLSIKYLNQKTSDRVSPPNLSPTPTQSNKANISSLANLFIPKSVTNSPRSRISLPNSRVYLTTTKKPETLVPQRKTLEIEGSLEGRGQRGEQGYYFN